MRSHARKIKTVPTQADVREKEFFENLTREQSDNFQKNLLKLALTRKYTSVEISSMPEWVRESLRTELA